MAALKTILLSIATMYLFDIIAR